MAHETGRTHGTPVLADRRRAGRPAHVSPDLIPLLRGQWREPAPIPPRRNADDLRAVRGIAGSVVACAVFWLGVAALLR